MGASGSTAGASFAELRTAQAQVKRLAADVGKFKSAVAAKDSALSGAKREMAVLAGVRTELGATRQELQATSLQLLKAKRATHELPVLQEQVFEPKEQADQARTADKRQHAKLAETEDAPQVS